MSTPTVEKLKQGELDIWQIKTAGAELLVAEQGAQVLSYTRTGEQPLIWLNDHAEFKLGKAIRAGVPVCWPWFGSLARNPQAIQQMREGNDPAPSHGLVRTLKWNLAAPEIEDDKVTLTFLLPEADGRLPGWPHAARLELKIVLADTLSLSLTTLNLGVDTLHLSQALHTYFAVSDVRQVAVEEVAGLQYVETLEDWEQRTQSGQLEVTGETDRVYLQTPARLSIADSGWDRRILIDTQGSASAVIWNPWIERAAALPDMTNDGWQRMFCIETANVLADARVLAPGESHTMTVTFSSEAL
ncbi:D-hexose-6-phosphate mutarotase [Pseudomonas sp. RIT-PI-S]|uniref:D-hexose-6-phosphate mutarotase n=1 Tax=Pseudomonas sp. RIT-PI-S TaxID=3035295 RepID=UPI0021D8A8BE|nr:D-hexose-6-phosphate mutarotase [Pseudomonas sp. RIT-PI-S]